LQAARWRAVPTDVTPPIESEPLASGEVESCANRRHVPIESEPLASGEVEIGVNPEKPLDTAGPRLYKPKPVAIIISGL